MCGGGDSLNHDRYGSLAKKNGGDGIQQRKILHQSLTWNHRLQGAVYLANGFDPPPP